MPEGGALLFETGEIRLDEQSAAEHVDAVPGDYVTLTVKDSGHGMDRETRSRIFEPFFTTKAEGRGTGLGLSTTYAIVEESGGKIWVYSEPGQGTTFKVFLPRVAAEEKPREPARPPATELEGSETVLLVEDDREVRRVTRRALERFGYAVWEAESAEDALRVFLQDPDRIHLLVTDVVLPGMPGTELAKTLASLRPRLRVLFVSGYTKNTIARSGQLPPGAVALEKPFTPNALMGKVRELLDRPQDHGS